MGSKIFWGCILVAMCVGGYFIYDHIRQEQVMTNGDVSCIGCMTPEQSARFAKENSGETADGQSEHKIRSARADAAAAANPEAVIAASQTAPQAAATATAIQPTPAPAPAAQPVVTSAPQTYTASSGPAPANLPVRDSIAPNPPNEVHFSGSGNFQWYRQGNLTWRVDTVSGRSCIDYATLEEWRKQIVSSHGCGRGV